MSETDAATKPAEAAQAPQVVEEQPQAVDDKPQAEEEKPASAETKPEAAAEKPEAPGEKPEVAEEKPATNVDGAGILKTTAKIDHDNHRKNVKFDPSTREVTDDPEVIRKQVEFYFGDWNFPQDKFMWETCEGTSNKPMAIAKIHSFKRMRVFQPYSSVVAALRDSQFLEVSGEEGEEVVKRKVPYKPMGENRVKVEAATVYVKGFGDENPDTQFDLESFFAKFGEIEGLKLRRTNEGLFKGSVFATFPDEETAKRFIETDPAPTYKGHELKIMSKRAYCDEKSELIRQGKLEPNSQSQKKFFEGRDANKKGAKDRDHRGNRDSDDWKKRRDNDQKHGFQDRRGGGRGRGFRGRGRGAGRGRGGRDGGRDGGGRGVKPRIQSTAEETTTNGKRSRDGDGAGEGAPAAKKVDTKGEAKAEAS
ncbi:La protein [Tolypocladium ophioglossoides CBS 100239]|uniref:La protein n=1 Tax=Tolypocladium ophioglossoides (strain CBS 100239) TaxID=1163406 RepID=A0A0L0N8A2_TOLOC|nr:La protein [Tolypocladium ophioglossoides CBS 100239]